MKSNIKTYLVAGTGISGMGAVSLLQKIDANIILYDENDKLTKEEIKKKLENSNNVEIIIGELPDDIIDKTDIMVISPGVPIDAEFVNRVRDKGVTIWGEIELAYRLGKGRIAAITGTNGKTTTTALVGEIAKNYFDSTFVVGNIGNPYTNIAYETIDESVIVAEISSFQLETIDEFHPEVTAVLNITPDHLNRHYTMENYTDVKMSIAKNQSKDEICILNYEDKILRKYSKKLNCKVVFFSSKRKLDEGISLLDKTIIYSADCIDTPILNIDEMNLVGMHNVENVMAAIGIAMGLGVPVSIIRKTIIDFKAVEHRIEYVATKKGVIYYNDSKGTNPDASIKAVEAMTKPTIVIAGGYDKNSTYDEWINTFGEKVKGLILMGETKDKIAKAARAQGFNNITMVDSMQDAVNEAASQASEGYEVLLSPCCASWGMFKNYEERGRIFKECVNALED
ncbi:MAG: UDP-N-acetylmuramoyl-L-alanine--D-glutamate ligase [Eubacterium sp.]